MRLGRALWRKSLLPVALLAILAWPAAAADLRRVTIRGNGRDLGETPITVALKGSYTPGAYALSPPSGGHEIVALVYPLDGKTYLSFVIDHLKPDANEVFSARRVEKPDPASPGVELKPDGANTRVDVNGHHFTTLIVDPKLHPYLYPLIGPTGAPMTRAYPMEKNEGDDIDHPHHRSLWFTHGTVSDVDFWGTATNKNHGVIHELSREAISGPGASAGVIRTDDEWLTAKGEKVCDDERIMTFYGTKNTRVMDFDITLKAAGKPVTFQDTKEGMFAIRVASSMDVDTKKNKKTVKNPDSKITNAEGVTDGAAWGKPSAWVDYVGPVRGEKVGIAILNHPDSFRYPTTWHVRTYGLYAANPFGWHDFGRKEKGDHTIEPGKPIHFKYRVILHKGETSAADVPTAFQAFAKPPEIDVQAD